MFKSVRPEFTTLDTLRDYLLAEIFISFGLRRDGWVRKRFEHIFYEPATRFSQMALQFDALTRDKGFAAAAADFMPQFVRDVRVYGAAHIPASGPTLILANHPGTYDSLWISSLMPRNDYKIIVSDIPFLAGLAHVREHLIFTLRGDPHIRMATMRAALRHVQQGGALLVFPSTHIDPDPTIWPEAQAHIPEWSGSLDMFTRLVPDAQAVITITSGIIDPYWARHPLTWLRRRPLDKRRLAEFAQVLTQLWQPGKRLVAPCVSFDTPVRLSEMSGRGGLVQRALNQLDAHMERFYA